MARNLRELMQAVTLAMPGWTFVTPPASFTWAPDRHLRARLRSGQAVRDAILRQSWRETSHQVELLLYRHVLPQMPFRTAQLWAAFCLDSDESLWMVLEDLGSTTAQAGNETDRRSLLYALGQLHGRGILLLESKRLDASPLPRFDGQQLPFGPNMVPLSRWQELLARAVASASYDLEAWVMTMPQALLVELADHPATFLHGDADFGNAVVVDGGVGLIDFERGMLGPPAFDIGRIMEYVQLSGELDAYRHGFSEASGQPLDPRTLDRWCAAGDVYNCLRWICYYIEATVQGRDLDKERQRTYEPLRRRLEHLHASGWPQGHWILPRIG